MSAASVFDFHFTPEDAEEGGRIAIAIGTDMAATEGYVRHDVIHDFADPGHVVVSTFWHERSQGEAVLKDYVHDAKVRRAAELIGTEPTGFLGNVD